MSIFNVSEISPKTFIQNTSIAQKAVINANLLVHARADEQKRSPFPTEIVVCIDTSSSMFQQQQHQQDPVADSSDEENSEQKKPTQNLTTTVIETMNPRMQMIFQIVLFLIDDLRSTEGDKLGIVFFDSTAEIVVDLKTMQNNDKAESLKHFKDKLIEVSEQSNSPSFPPRTSNVSGGLFKSIDLFSSSSSSSSSSSIQTVFLFTDSQLNDGIIDAETLAEETKKRIFSSSSSSARNKIDDDHISSVLLPKVQICSFIIDDDGDKSSSPPLNMIPFLKLAQISQGHVAHIKTSSPRTSSKKSSSSTTTIRTRRQLPDEFLNVLACFQTTFARDVKLVGRIDNSSSKEVKITFDLNPEFMSSNNNVPFYHHIHDEPDDKDQSIITFFIKNANDFDSTQLLLGVNVQVINQNFTNKTEEEEDDGITLISWFLSYTDHIISSIGGGKQQQQPTITHQRQTPTTAKFIKLKNKSDLERRLKYHGSPTREQKYLHHASILSQAKTKTATKNDEEDHCESANSSYFINTREECEEAFSLFDKDEEGVMSAHDLGLLMRCMGYNPTEDQLSLFIGEEMKKSLQPAIRDRSEWFFDAKTFYKICMKFAAEERQISRSSKYDGDPLCYEGLLIQIFRALDFESKGYISEREAADFLIWSSGGTHSSDEEALDTLRDCAEKHNPEKVSFEQCAIFVHRDESGWDWERHQHEREEVFKMNKGRRLPSHEDHYLSIPSERDDHIESLVARFRFVKILKEVLTLGKLKQLNEAKSLIHRFVTDRHTIRYLGRRQKGYCQSILIDGLASKQNWEGTDQIGCSGEAFVVEKIDDSCRVSGRCWRKVPDLNERVQMFYDL